MRIYEMGGEGGDMYVCSSSSSSSSRCQKLVGKVLRIRWDGRFHSVWTL